MLFMGIPVILYFWIRYAAIGFILSENITRTGIMNDPYSDAGLLQKYATILLTLLIYLKLMFIPWPLTHDYYPWHIALQSAANPWPWSALVVLFILGYLIYIKRKTLSPWIFAVLYFFITLSIVSNVLVNVGTLMNERFLFIPSIGFSILAVCFIGALSRLPSRLARYGAWGIPVVLCILFIFISFVRIPDWKSSKILDHTDVLTSRNSARANLFAGVSLWKDILEEKNDTVKLKMIMEARAFNDRALEIYPEYADALKMKAGYAAEIWKINKDIKALLNEFEQAVSVKPVPYVEEFINWLLPRSDKKMMLSFLYRVGYELFAQKQKNFPEALSYLRKGYQLDNNDASILFGLCIISGLSGNHRDAVEFGNRYQSLYGRNEEVLQHINRSAGQISLNNRIPVK
jgi:tetratricopeptide (TPR) repeat protein